ncbi:hypothetical protein [Mesorhizobium carmichaelinearum]|nr:hypothetical protein [Mesorhizobium carmichaelinearum]
MFLRVSAKSFLLGAGKKDFSSEFGAPDGTLTDKASFQTVRIGAKYKFN